MKKIIDYIISDFKNEKIHLKPIVFLILVAIFINILFYATTGLFGLYTNDNSWTATVPAAGALILALPGAYITFKRQQALEKQNHLSEIADLNDRFVKATELLSKTDIVSKIAGVRAIATLADDWIKLTNDQLNSQTKNCIYLLRDYLRTEPDKDDGNVRDTIVEEFRTRLTDNIAEDKESWIDCKINFNKAKFNNADFSNCKFNYVNFNDAIFRGYTIFKEAQFKIANFQRASFSKKTNFTNVDFKQGAIFDGATYLIPPIGLEKKFIDKMRHINEQN